MKKIVMRILAFALDIGLVSLIITGLSMLTPLNPHHDKLNESYQEYYSLNSYYLSLKEKLEEVTENKIIDALEYDDLTIFYKDYRDIFADTLVESTLTEEEISSLKEEVEKKYTELINPKVIEINKLNIPETIISIVVYLAYFGLLQYILKGQTPFKRVFRIKILPNKTRKKPLSLGSYLIRAILVSETILLLGDILVNSFLSNQEYIVVNYWLQQIKYVYELAFIVCMLIRDDNRSLDDLILSTRVIRYDKKGKEIHEQLFLNEENAQISNQTA